MAGNDDYVVPCFEKFDYRVSHLHDERTLSRKTEQIQTNPFICVISYLRRHQDVLRLRCNNACVLWMENAVQTKRLSKLISCSYRRSRCEGNLILIDLKISLANKRRNAGDGNVLGLHNGFIWWTKRWLSKKDLTDFVLIISEMPKSRSVEAPPVFINPQKDATILKKYSKAQ